MARRLPPLNALRAFEAAARRLSFTRAADELNVSQAAVSQQIKRLEERLGEPLFRRHPRGLALTDAGQAYLPSVRTAFDRLERATEQLFGGDGILAVRVGTSLAVLWLVPRLSIFQAAHPGTEVHLVTAKNPDEFTGDGVDMEIRYGRGTWPGLASDRLFGEEIFPVCHPRVLEGSLLLRHPAALVDQPLLHVVGYEEDWHMWLRAAGVEGIDPTRGLQFDTSVTALQAARDGLGIALGRTPLVAGDLADGRLVAPFDLTVPVDRAYHLVYRQSAAQRPRVTAFRQWLLAEAERTGGTVGNG